MPTQRSLNMVLAPLLSVRSDGVPMSNNPEPTVPTKLIWSAVVTGVILVFTVSWMLLRPPPFPYINLILTAMALVVISGATICVIQVQSSHFERDRREAAEIRTAAAETSQAELRARKEYENDVAEFLGDILREQKEQTHLLKRFTSELESLSAQHESIDSRIEECKDHMSAEAMIVARKIADLRNAWLEDGLPPKP